MEREQDPNGRFLPPRRIYKITAKKIDGEWCPVIDGKVYQVEYPKFDNKRECVEWATTWADRIVKQK